MTDTEKVNSIIRHIKKVEDNCNLLAQKLMTTDPIFARNLIVRGRLHDISKFKEFEFKYLWTDIEHKEKFKYALKSHHFDNSHHPEHYKDGIKEMSDLDLAEMCCDVLARSQEFGTDIKTWLFETAIEKYNFKKDDKIYKKLEKYINLLLTPTFK